MVYMMIQINHILYPGLKIVNLKIIYQLYYITQIIWHLSLNMNDGIIQPLILQQQRRLINHMVAIRKLGNIANNNTPNKNAAKLFEDLFGDVK